MGIVIEFPSQRTFRVLFREGMRARYDDPANWRRTASGRESTCYGAAAIPKERLDLKLKHHRGTNLK
jgi:hypothetical protein